jgi:CHU_C Type IX secretion signal domain
MAHIFRGMGLLVCLLLQVGIAQATHIVGGEIGLSYVRRGTYDLRLTLYFDRINGSVGAIDQQTQLFIFSKAGGNLVQTVIMDLDPGVSLVGYSNPDCEAAPGAVSTRILTYLRRISLSPSTYTDLGGYYIVWERCCRNGTITNIEDPGGTGQAFYMEFPAIRRGPNTEDTLKNSSPTLFRPLSDFACVNQNFSFDFSGFDADGDSLAYSLAPPLRGNTSRDQTGAYPSDPIQPVPAPYPQVVWAPGYSNTVQINGRNRLSIDARTGFLRMTPGQVGLFVFAIECREYRNGRFLGLVRREFQVFVRDCPYNSPPKIVLNREDGSRYRNGDTLTVPLKLGGACIPLTILDSLPDSEVLSFSSREFPTGIRISQLRGNAVQGSFTTELCFDECMAFNTVRYGYLVIRVRDNFCSIPNRDSLLLVVAVIPPVRPDVHIVPLKGFPSSVDTVLKVGTYQLQVLVADSTYPVTALATATPPLPGGISISSNNNQRRQIFNMSLQVPCSVDTSITYRLAFLGRVVRCSRTYTDTLTLRFKTYRLSGETYLALIDANGDTIQTDRVRLRVGENLDITAQARVTDTSTITLKATSTLPTVLASGPAQVQRLLSASLRIRWQPSCLDALATAGDSIRLRFSAESERCLSVKQVERTLTISLRDTLQKEVNVPNLITLQADSLNDYFKLIAPLPIENCSGGFEGVEIFNRWGRIIYRSSDKNFTWQPPTAQPALYFYRIRFAGQAFRGWVEATGS